MDTYIIRVGATGPVKIGRAINVRARRKELQTAHYEDLRIIRVMHADVEHALHKRFADLRIRGEWFHYDDAMLSIEVIEAREPQDEFEKEVRKYQDALEGSREANGTAHHDPETGEIGEASQDSVPPTSRTAPLGTPEREARAPTILPSSAPVAASGKEDFSAAAAGGPLDALETTESCGSVESKAVSDWSRRPPEHASRSISPSDGLSEDIGRHDALAGVALAAKSAQPTARECRIPEQPEAAHASDGQVAGVAPGPQDLAERPALQELGAPSARPDREPKLIDTLEFPAHLDQRKRQVPA